MCKFTGLLILFFLSHLSAGVSPVQAANDPLTSRMQNMSRLLNESSGARQVIDGSSEEAMAKRQQALELYRRAAEEIAAGRRDEVPALLDSSARLMFEAIKLATPASMLQDKQIVDYGSRRESVNALREAFNRIADETRDGQAKQQIDRQLTALIDRADGLLARGKNDAARVEIDKAYHLLKISIESKRKGQTLVRTLNFESEEEEYLYEVDRNDTHSMLIDLLIDDKRETADSRAAIDGFLEQARQLRQQADAYAREDQFKIAIDLLEQSTRELVRAIRGAGIYIPG